jgi:hypothetical protein
MRANVALLVAEDPILRALWQQLLHVHDGRWSFVHSPGGHEALRALELHEPVLVVAEALPGPVDVIDLVERATTSPRAPLVVLAGDSPVPGAVASGNVARLSRVTSGTVELTHLVQDRLDGVLDLSARARDGSGHVVVGSDQRG